MAVHDHLRAELAQVVRAVQVAVVDHRRATDARARVNDLSSSVDPAAIGSFCRRWCRVVETEDRRPHRPPRHPRLTPWQAWRASC